MATPLPTGPPSSEAWLGLPGELWERVVVHLRRVLSSLPPDAVDARTRRLVASPPTRLRGGRTRRDAARVLAEGGPAWTGLRARVEADGDLRDVLADALADGPVPPGAAAPAPSTASDDRADDRDRTARLRERVRDARRERDDAERRASGEAARAGREAAARAAAESRVSELEARVRELEEEVAGSRESRAASVERARRRRDARVAELESELRTSRREVDRLQRALRDAEQAAVQRAGRRPSGPDRGTTRRAGGRSTPEEEEGSDRVVPGRPTRLPPGVRPETTEGVLALLARGRVVLVDGYNVTRRHQAGLSLEQQRRWIVDLLAAARARFGIEPTVVFDGHRAGGSGSSTRTRGVLVAFTPAGQTADDDLVFQAAAAPPDEPLVVVTDDAELRERLRAHAVDLLHTTAFVRALA